jgi:hypothetical protein
LNELSVRILVHRFQDDARIQSAIRRDQLANLFDVGFAGYDAETAEVDARFSAAGVESLGHCLPAVAGRISDYGVIPMIERQAATLNLQSEIIEVIDRTLELAGRRLNVMSCGPTGDADA